MKSIKNKILMITGGTGSFGNIVVSKFLKTGIKEIRIFSRDEKKQEDMRINYNNKKIKFIIGDVRDYNSINQAIRGVDYVFHAAALKQVPSCEFYPMEAIKTNVIGTENVLNAAIQNSVKRVVVLSTDKAVYPINAMGMSKGMMEKLMVSKGLLNSNGATIFSATRYGNVMASRGSVIPLFVDLIKKGKPLTVTDPNMTRFLMSLEDSVGLVMHAFKFGKQGDIFVQKSPACTILDLAKVLIEIFGGNNKIKIIGTRHGEKLFETLLSREEMHRAKNNKNYYCIPADKRNLNYDSYFVKGVESISSGNDYTSHKTERLSLIKLKKLLLKLDFIKDELNA